MYKSLKLKGFPKFIQRRFDHFFCSKLSVNFVVIRTRIPFFSLITLFHFCLYFLVFLLPSNSSSFLQLYDVCLPGSFPPTSNPGRTVWKFAGLIIHLRDISIQMSKFYAWNQIAKTSNWSFFWLVLSALIFKTDCQAHHWSLKPSHEFLYRLKRWNCALGVAIWNQKQETN